MAQSTRHSSIRSFGKLAGEFISAVRSSPDIAHLTGLLEAVTREMGFRHFALIHHARSSALTDRLVDIRRYPASITERIIGQQDYRRDPVTRACSYTEGAFLWSELDRLILLDRGDHSRLQQGRVEGLNEGITVPCSILGQPMGSCTFAGTAHLGQAECWLGPAQLIGVFAFQAARRLLADAPPEAARRLHPRPRDCVLLAGRGLAPPQLNGSPRSRRSAIRYQLGGPIIAVG